MALLQWRHAAACISVVAVSIVGSACSSGGTRDAATTTKAAFNGSITLTLEHPDRCDPLDTRHCLLPFPSDTFTVADTTTPTGRRVAFARASMPVNRSGVHIDPAEWNRSDGFSPGQAISVFVGAGNAPGYGKLFPVVDIGRSLATDARVVLLDATTGKRWPFWAEADASVADRNDQVLYIRPARNYPDGHRIVVALRNITDAAGKPVAPSDAFRAYRDRLQTSLPAVESRRARYERVFADLAKAGVKRDRSLYLAWDFTVASTQSLTGRMVHIRDDAFASIGAGAPKFTVDNVEANPDDNIARRVSGTIDVPLYLSNGGAPGGQFVYGTDGLPKRVGTYHAGYLCVIPPSALRTPARASIYGHGLLGSNDEVNAGNVRAMASEHNIVFCATKWIGLSDEDISNSIKTLSDASNMVTTADRLQQGMLNALVLARAMKSPDGFVTNAAFQSDLGKPVIASGTVYYDGNSQGGIMGGGLTAVSTDFTRAVLGVSGMNYSTLLQRSSDWETYRAVFDPSYPNVIERGLVISLLQMLWDRGEANGYANHIATNPLPGTPNHTVLMEIAVGDWQVSNWTALVEARTIGAKLHCPALADSTTLGKDPFFGVPCIDNDPFGGSSIWFWDSGTPGPPLDNRAPTTGRDPHEDPRAAAVNREQKSRFLEPDGGAVDLCHGPCKATSTD